MQPLDQIMSSAGWYPLRVATRRNPTEADFARLESLSGGRLPDDFRRFLSRYSLGATRDRRWFPIKEPCSWGQFGILDQFLGFDDSSTGSEIESTFDIFAGRIPPGMIVFAYDPGGNLLLLNVKGNDAGKVWFWDHENRPRPDSADTHAQENIYFVAENFSEFLESLQAAPEQQSENSGPDLRPR